MRTRSHPFRRCPAAAVAVAAAAALSHGAPDAAPQQGPRPLRPSSRQGRGATPAAGGCVRGGVANASCFGWDPVDSTWALQAALNATGASTVRVDCAPSPGGCVWQTQPLFVYRSRVRLVLAAGVVLQARRGFFHALGDKLLKVREVSDVAVVGECTPSSSACSLPVLRMHRSDYANLSMYNKSEWRHGLSIEDSSRVEVGNLCISETGGDGVYIEGNVDTVHVHDVILDRNYRQGLSLISGSNILVERAVLSNTNGTNPQGGLDIEPNDPSSSFANVTFQDCVSVNNSGAAAYVSLKKLSAASTPIGITFRDFAAVGGRSDGFAVSGVAPGLRGRIVLDRCRVEGTAGSGIYIGGKSGLGAPVAVSRCSFDRVARCEEPSGCHGMGATPVMLAGSGGVSFESCEVTDDRNRTWFDGSNVSDIKADFAVTNPFGCRATVPRDSRNVTVSVSNCSAAADTSVAVVQARGFALSVTADCRARLVVDRGQVYNGGPLVGDFVPLASLYNRVADARPRNLEPCVAAAVVSDVRASSGARNVTLALTAANGYGEICVAIGARPTDPSVIFSVVAVDTWRVESASRIVAFGEFWSGLGVDDPAASALVMGRLQGWRGRTGLATPAPPSAGYVTLGRATFYRFVTDAAPGAALAFVFAPTTEVDHAWQTIAAEHGVDVTTSAAATSAWYWTNTTTTESDVSRVVERATSLGCETVMIAGAVDPRTWRINASAYPSGIRAAVARMRAAGLRVGLHTLPYPPSNCTGACATATLVPEGLAPTYRSGSIGHPRLHVWVPTEDLGFWWGHEGAGDVAANGNPTHNQYGWECPQRVIYQCTRWGSNMSLFNTAWSPLGDYRQGGSIGFDGVRSYGAVAQTSRLDTIVADGLSNATELTLGIASVIKATFNGTSRRAAVFVDNTCVGDAYLPVGEGKKDGGTVFLAKPPGRPPIYFGAEGPEVAAGFWGSLEEIYLKNVSTEARVALVYTDNVRPDPAAGIHLFAFERPEARAYFAELMSDLLNTAEYDVTQWDGFETQLLVAGGDFPRSAATARSGLYRAPPAPDWYDVGWPLKWGQGVLYAMEDAVTRVKGSIDVEASFMAPGLGPWRPSMAPYVDEIVGPGGLVELGLEWHPKILYRIEQSGVVINPYGTRMYWFQNAQDVDYWVGGLITGGVSPQFTESTGPIRQWDEQIRGWLAAHAEWGRVVPGGVTTLAFDSGCCHTEGDCEWVACNDTVVSRLARASGAAVAGVYVGDPSLTVVPLDATPDNSTVLVFVSQAARSAHLVLGSAITRRLEVVPTSPVGGSYITLYRGIASAVPLRVTTYDRGGAVVRRSIVNATAGAVRVDGRLLYRTVLERVSSLHHP